MGKRGAPWRTQYLVTFIKDTDLPKEKQIILL